MDAACGLAETRPVANSDTRSISIDKVLCCKQIHIFLECNCSPYISSGQDELMPVNVLM